METIGLLIELQQNVNFLDIVNSNFENIPFNRTTVECKLDRQ